MDQNLTWLFSIPTGMMVVFCIVAISIVVGQTTGRGRPKQISLFALFLILMLNLTNPVLHRLLNGSLLVHGIINIVSTMALMLALSLLLIATFSKRDSDRLDDSGETDGIPLADHPSDNPYAAPRR